MIWKKERRHRILELSFDELKRLITESDATNLGEFEILELRCTPFSGLVEALLESDEFEALEPGGKPRPIQLERPASRIMSDANFDRLAKKKEDQS